MSPGTQPPWAVEHATPNTHRDASGSENGVCGSKRNDCGKKSWKADPADAGSIFINIFPHTNSINVNVLSWKRRARLAWEALQRKIHLPTKMIEPNLISFSKSQFSVRSPPFIALHDFLRKKGARAARRNFQCMMYVPIKMIKANSILRLPTLFS